MRKQIILDFVKEILPADFENKIYWANERKDEPKKPFCLLRAIVPEQTDSRTSERELAGNIQEVTMYKNMVVTFAIYNDGVAEDGNLDEKNYFAESNARKLKTVLSHLMLLMNFWRMICQLMIYQSYET